MSLGLARRGMLAVRRLAAAVGITDLFNRADSATTLGTTDTGQVWSAITGTWGIGTNAARIAVNGAGGQNIAVVQTALANVDTSVTLSVVGEAGSGQGVCFRVVDDPNYLMVEPNSGGSLQLYTRVGGGFSVIAQIATTAWVAGDVLRVLANGSAISVFRNGGAAQLSTTSTAHQTATMHGLRSFNANTVNRWDNFSVTGV